MPPSPGIKVDTNPTVARPQTSQSSAIISYPSSWDDADSSHDRTLSPTEVMSTKLPQRPSAGSGDSDMMPARTLSNTSQQSSAASGTSSASAPMLGWPLRSEPSTSRSDPFDATRSFSEDPFGPSGSSSSSGDDIDEQHLAASTASAARPHVHHTSTDWEPQVAPYPLYAGDTDLEGGPSDGRMSALSRTFSSPSVGGLLQPRTTGQETDPWHYLSTELVDSLQTAIQTLLYVSPPHLLDNAKEQYSGCAIPMPVTTLSALLTSMRGLNYLAANLGPLAQGQAGGVRSIEDFDIGELLQNVADQLSGEAAQAEVDLVLFHGDIGMKHVNMNGDRSGIAYVLSHVIRQILAVANKGDTLELGLQLVPQSTPPRRVSIPAVHADMDEYRRRSSTISPVGSEGPVMCIFEIIHNVSQNVDMNVATPKAELNPFTRLAEQKEESTPQLDTELCRRLLRQIQAWVKTDTDPTSPSIFGLTRHGYELAMVLPRGAPIVEPAPLTPAEEAVRQPYSGLHLPREPTLGELADFADTLRGRKINLHASLSSLFARHLTSYLTAWGLDVSHTPIEEEPPVPAASDDNPAPKFVVIDDDVDVLRRELLKIRNDVPAQPILTRQKSTMKRPDLLRSAKSSFFIRQACSTVVIHFTSLHKYHQVRDVIASIGLQRLPEVIVVPKPVGPRRFLTALYTAVKQPIVDPVFSPIATSPKSPQMSSGNRTPTGGPQESFFDAVTYLQASDPTNPRTVATRSPLSEVPIASAPLPRTEDMRLTPSGEDLVTTPASEYFSRAATSKSPTSGASGVVIQSPDGRPYGMFFEPRSASGGKPSLSERSSLRKTMSRNQSMESEKSAKSSVSSSPSGSMDSNHRMLAPATEDSSSPVSTPRPLEGDKPSRAAPRPKLPTPPDSAPIMAAGRNRSSTVTRRQIPPVAEAAVPPEAERKTPDVIKAKAVVRPAKAVAKASDVVIPPINVLIVEDNPINQNILSMFFRKKKIKHQTAKDGQEAVEKWRTGGFHLILMDIQLPVMDGIEATKEIRKLEKMNHIGVFPSTPVGEHPRSIDEVPASSPFRSAVIIVALTASSLQTDRVAALAAGCNDFLTKPVSLKWLEKKTVEWGCMQALIDFDGWRRWKGSDVGEMKRGFQFGPQAAARTVASKLRIDRSKGRKGSTGSASSIDKEGKSSPAVADKPLPALPVEQ